ncbi:KdsC family phosphatase [Arcticibacterium luteifluviistationis]|uniref:3-deoxy-D-manno-octulosonate 8-phosphate phosphatase n=1 Tax=Arcticibacterium luteifluviistationis TaxID=1784714 RepID=A0A2Z4GAK8_9BACT|nr:HAD family hydrolase [Arcticibacterium luteifluviistationis]AWV98108.1 3-deoxy-D-manno-octulosonate 8-phosphate phosphatase [Arcticibacterium luteifluviistationis]
MDIKLRSKLSKIKTFVFDVDGVFTDGRLIVTDLGVDRVFNVRDGYAVAMAIKAGYKTAVISGGKQDNIKTRLGGLGIHEIHLSVSTDGKLAVFENLLKEWNISAEEVLYIGDDIPDLLLMKNTKVFKACPADAEPEVKEVADYISPVNGGAGVVRDVIKLVMKEQDKWMKVF